MKLEERVSGSAAVLAAFALLAFAGCTNQSSHDSRQTISDPVTLEARRPVSPGPPARAFVETSAEPAAPLLVAFRVRNEQEFDTGTFHWEFGDGETADDPAPAHGYERGGSYSARLEYIDNKGKDQTVEWVLRVNNPPLLSIEDAGVLPDTGGMGVWLQGTASDVESAIDPGSLAWDFGDGTRATGNRVTHVYSGAGSYTVSVSVRDAQGAVARDEVEVEVVGVTAAPAPAPPAGAPGDDGAEGDAAGDGGAAEPPPGADPGPLPGAIADGGSDAAGGEEAAEPSSPGDGSVSEPAIAPQEPLVDGDTDGGPTIVSDEIEESDLWAASTVRLDFESAPEWIDGSVLALTSDPTHVYGGGGALEIRWDAGSLPPAALAALQGMLSPFATAPQVHASWLAMSNRASSLDPARARATLEAALAAAPGALDATQTALLWQFVDSLESSALPAMPIEANAWYCFELAAVVAAGETSPRLDITLGVRGQVVFRGSLAAGSSGQAVLSLVPFLIQAAAAPNAGSVTWIDNLRVHATPSIGCE